MRSSSSTARRPRLLLVAAAAAACCLALVLALGACTASTGGGGGVGAAHDGRPRPPSTSSSPALGVESLVAARVNGYYPAGGDAFVRGGGGRELRGAAVVAEQDYGFVDPTPDTRRRGGTAPIPHN